MLQLVLLLRSCSRHLHQEMSKACPALARLMPRQGEKGSAEAKANMSAAQKGKEQSKVTRAKRSAALKAYFAGQRELKEAAAAS